MEASNDEVAGQSDEDVSSDDGSSESSESDLNQRMSELEASVSNQADNPLAFDFRRRAAKGTNI